MDARTSQSVIAWDLPVRLFHWTLVLLLASAWVSFQYAEALGDFRLKWHRWNGYAILVLIAWRLLWGFVGPPRARFSSFVSSPIAALRYARDLFDGRARHYLGHNPLGAWMVLALIAVVASQAALGLFAVEHNDLATGPLYRLVGNELAKQLTRWHSFTFHWLVLPLVVLHVAANVLYGLLAREPLVKAMVTGRKPLRPYEDAVEAAPQGMIWLRALGVLVAAAVLVFGTILALGGRL